MKLKNLLFNSLRQVRIYVLGRLRNKGGHRLSWVEFGLSWNFFFDRVGWVGHPNKHVNN